MPVSPFEHLKWKWVDEGVFNDGGVKNLSLQQSWLASQLTIWEISFAALHHRLREGPPIAEMESGLVITQIYCDMFGLVSNAILTGMKISYDACYAKFERMLTLIDSPCRVRFGLSYHHKAVKSKDLQLQVGCHLPAVFHRHAVSRSSSPSTSACPSLFLTPP